jgi:hypothetical protein
MTALPESAALKKVIAIAERIAPIITVVCLLFHHAGLSSQEVFRLMISHGLFYHMRMNNTEINGG